MTDTFNYHPTPTTSEPKLLGKIEYAIDSVAPFTIYAWNTEAPNPGGEPFWFQPHDLHGEAWPDAETAEAFAVKHIDENFVNPVLPEVIQTTAESVTPPAPTE